MPLLRSFENRIILASSIDISLLWSFMLSDGICAMLTNAPNVAVSDTTNDDSSSEPRLHNYHLSSKELIETSKVSST